MHDSSLSLSAWLDAAAAKSSTPGGGAVSAVAGALAAAMGEMVVNFSIGKKDLAIFADHHAAALRAFANARQVLLELMREDQLAFDQMMAVRKLPAGPERDIASIEATRACIRVPMAIAGTAVVLLQEAAKIIDKSNRWLLSDLIVSAELAMATARCAAVNVRINLDHVINPSEQAALSEEIDELVNRAKRLIQTVIPAIERTMREE